ncbi:histone deacetylase, partial [Serendipita sp. 399]
MKPHRLTLTNSLVISYKLDSFIDQIHDPLPASREELEMYHDPRYLTTLERRTKAASNVPILSDSSTTTTITTTNNNNNNIVTTSPTTSNNPTSTSLTGGGSGIRRGHQLNTLSAGGGFDLYEQEIFTDDCPV